MIKFIARKPAKISSWTSDEPWLLPGDIATIRDNLTKSGTRLDLLLVERDKDGQTKAIHYHILAEYGEFYNL